MATTFTAGEQLVRARLAGVTPEEFARLRVMLDAVRLSTESRLAAVESERATLLARKQRLDQALQQFGKANALDTLRTALQKGERLKLGAAAETPAKKPGKVPGKKVPAKKVPAKKVPAKTPVRRPGG